MVFPISQPPEVSLRGQENRKSGIRHFSLHTAGLRSYSPELGRWINRDPIGERGGANTYALVQNQTIASIDLLGAIEWVEKDNGVIEELKKELQNHEAFLNVAEKMKGVFSVGPLPKEILHDGKEQAMLIYRIKIRCQKCEIVEGKAGKPISGHYSTFYALRNMVATGEEGRVLGFHIQAAKDAQRDTAIGKLFALYREQDGMPISKPHRTSVRAVPPQRRIRCEITYLKDVAKVHSHPYTDPGPSKGDIDLAKGSPFEALFVLWPEYRGGIANNTNKFWFALYDEKGESGRAVLSDKPE